MPPSRQVAGWMASLALAGLSGCTTPPLLLKLMPNSKPRAAASPAPTPTPVAARPAPDLAALQLDTTLVLYVAKLNDHPISGQLALLELAPGVQTLSLRFHKDQLKSRAQAYGEFDLSFDAKPGQTYKVEFQTNKDFTKWSAYVWDLSEHRRMSRIITDLD